MGGVASPILGVTSTVYKQAFLHIHGKGRKRRRGELINFLHYLLQCLSFSIFFYFAVLLGEWCIRCTSSPVCALVSTCGTSTGVKSCVTGLVRSLPSFSECLTCISTGSASRCDGEGCDLAERADKGALGPSLCAPPLTPLNWDNSAYE